MTEMVPFKRGKGVVERINGEGGENFKAVLAAPRTWEILCPAILYTAQSQGGSCEEKITTWPWVTKLLIMLS